MSKTLPVPKTARSAPAGVARSTLRSAARMGDANTFEPAVFDPALFDPAVSGSGRGGAGRVKRYPLMVGGGVLFAAVAMFTGALLLNARGERRAVVVSAREIPAGTVIQTDMLRIEHIEADTQLPPLWSSSKAEPDEERAVSAPRGTHGRIRFFDAARATRRDI